MHSHRPRSLIPIACLLVPPFAVAQRADQNAVTAAEDAFGTSVGLQKVGLYSPTDARGFNPQQAGNLRIEGLYFDQETWVTSSCMVRETTMRVGIAAQSYSFPAPSGIADITLRTPGDKALVSAVLARGPFDGAMGELEGQLPLAGRTLGVDLCVAYHKNFDVDVGRTSHGAGFSATVRWRPTETTEILPVWSYLIGGERQMLPAVYTDGMVAPPLFRERDLGGEHWTTWGWRQTTLGLIAKSALGDQWRLAAGLFHSQERDPTIFDPYLTLNAGGTADYAVDVVPPFHANSTSGELRLARAFVNGNHRQSLELSIRGRAVTRDFGGDDLFDFGTVAFGRPPPAPEPRWTFTPLSLDRTRELDIGLTFEERWQGVGSVAIGILKDHYRRTVEVAAAIPQTTRATPSLLSLRFAAEGGHALLFYGGFVQGLEDSAPAPVLATNRGEPPPATRSWQVDGGVRYAPVNKLQFIFGAFDIHKPYFNLDAASVYRTLGRLRHRGLEGSLSYGNDGLTLLAGGVRLQPRVERVIAEPGATGDVPLGPVPLTLTVNLDYAPPRWGRWAASLQWNRLSSRAATTDDRLLLAPLETYAAGVRYQWRLLGRPATVRLDGFNLADARGLHVSNVEFFLPEQGRRFMLTLATDL
jgi:iron complex outermembrane receptor protein